MNNTVVIIGQSEYLSTLPVHLVTSVIQELVTMGYISVPETDSALVNRLIDMGYSRLEAENIYLRHKATGSDLRTRRKYRGYYVVNGANSYLIVENLPMNVCGCGGCC